MSSEIFGIVDSIAPEVDNSCTTSVLTAIAGAVRASFGLFWLGGGVSASENSALTD